jgi:flagellar protein FlaG
MPLKVAEAIDPGRSGNIGGGGEKVLNSEESVRALSDENRDATDSPATMDTAPFDKDRLKEALKAAKRLTEYSNRRLKFEYQEEADVFQVSVVDGNDEVIRKIPPDSVLRMVENLKRFMGTTLDTKA